jgi:hypothetical protein
MVPFTAVLYLCALTEDADLGENVVVTQYRFAAGERAPGTHWIGGGLGSRVGRPVRGVVVILTELSRLLGEGRKCEKELFYPRVLT